MTLQIINCKTTNDTSIVKFKTNDYEYLTAKGSFIELDIGVDLLL